MEKRKLPIFVYNIQNLSQIIIKQEDKHADQLQSAQYFKALGERSQRHSMHVCGCAGR